jgi:hypothetical protein
MRPARQAGCLQDLLLLVLLVLLVLLPRGQCCCWH